MTRQDRGSASLFVVTFLALLLVVGAALGVVAALVHDHRTAQAAADLASLAGAAAVAEGTDGCGAAQLIAGENGGSLTQCRVTGRDVWVEVTVTGPRWLGQDGDLVGRSRAGPASSEP